jgi:hypothetical protein
MRRTMRSRFSLSFSGLEGISDMQSAGSLASNPGNTLRA